MKQTYGMKVVVITTHEIPVIVKADDVHQATDAADDFARKNLTTLMGERAIFSGRQLETYAARASVLVASERVDVEV